LYLEIYVPTFWRSLLPPSPVEKSKAAGSVGTSPSFCQATWHLFPELRAVKHFSIEYVRCGRNQEQ